MNTNSWFNSPLDILQDGFDIVSGAISDGISGAISDGIDSAQEKVSKVVDNIEVMDVVRYGPLLPLTLANNVIDHFDTDGYYRVFRHGITHDLIGEGLPSAVGFVGDVVHGLGSSAIDLVTEGDLTNPFNRVTRSDGYTASFGRWGSEYIGQPLSDVYGAGDVEFRKPEDGGVFDWEYTVDQNDWKDANFGIGTIKVLANVADVVIPAGAFTKLRYFGAIGKLSQKVGLGAMAGGMTGIAMDALDHGDANDLIKLFNDPDALDSERGIRLLQRSLNEVNKDSINGSIDRVHKLQRQAREGGIEGQDAEDALGMKSASFLDDHGRLDRATAIGLRNASDIISQRDVLKTAAEDVKYYFSLDKVEAYDSVLALEEKFYNLAEQYMDDPAGFDPSQSEMLSMQMWMTGDSGFRFLELGLAGKEGTVEALGEYLGEQTQEWNEKHSPNISERDNIDKGAVQTGVNANESFNYSAEGVSVTRFLDQKQEMVSTERAVVTQKLDGLYDQKIQSMQYNAL